MSRKGVLNLVGLLVVSVNILNAQVPKESVLFQTLKEKDKIGRASCRERV